MLVGALPAVTHLMIVMISSGCHQMIPYGKLVAPHRSHGPVWCQVWMVLEEVSLLFHDQLCRHEYLCGMGEGSAPCSAPGGQRAAHHGCSLGHYVHLQSFQPPCATNFVLCQPWETHHGCPTWLIPLRTYFGTLLGVYPQDVPSQPFPSGEEDVCKMLRGQLPASG